MGEGNEAPGLSASASSRATAAFALLVASVVVAACSGSSSPSELYAGAIGSRNIRRGAYVFHHTCAACHRGRVDPVGYAWEPWRMRRQVREGNLVMPPIAKTLVSDDDLEAVLAYLTTIGAVRGELPPAPIWGRPVEPPELPAAMDGGVPTDAGMLGADAALDMASTDASVVGALDAALDAASVDAAIGAHQDAGARGEAGTTASTPDAAVGARAADAARPRTAPVESGAGLGRP